MTKKSISALLITSSVLLNANNDIEHKFFFSNDIKIDNVDLYKEKIETIRHLPNINKINYKKKFLISFNFKNLNAPDIKDKINKMIDNQKNYEISDKTRVVEPNKIYRIEMIHNNTQILDVKIDNVPDNIKKYDNKDIYIKINLDGTYTILNYTKTMKLNEKIVLKQQNNILTISIKNIKYQIQ